MPKKFISEVTERTSMLGSQKGLKDDYAIVLHVAEQYGISLLTKKREIKRKAPKIS